MSKAVARKALKRKARSSIAKQAITKKAVEKMIEANSNKVRSFDGAAYRDDYVKKILGLVAAQNEAVFDGDEIEALDEHLNHDDKASA